MKAPRSHGEGFPRHPIWISVAVSALMLAVLGAAELAARKYAPVQGEPDYAQYLFESSGPFFRTEIVQGRQEFVQVPRHRLFAHRQRFSLEKPAGLRRIVVIGESSALLLGQTLQAKTARKELPRRTEIINMAVGASDLEQTMRRFREALQYTPEAIVLLFGHNLFAQNPMVELSPYPGVDTLRLFLLKSRLIPLLSKYRLSRRPAVHFRTPGRWLVFRESLYKMADAAKRRGVRLALCTVPGNLHSPPFAGDPIRWAPEFLETKYLYGTGKKETAIRQCRLLLSRSPEPWWNFQLAEWLYQGGRYDEARRRLVAARDNDLSRDRASSAVNNIIREVALEKGLILFDFERLLSQTAPHGISGWESFLGNRHLSPPYLEFEAAECLRVLKAAEGFSSSQEGSSNWARVQLKKTLGSAFPMDPEVRSLRPAITFAAQAYLSAFLANGEAVIRDLRRKPEETAVLLSYVADAFWDTGHRARAMRLNEEARQLAPGESDFCLQRALFHLNSGEKTEAARWLREALRLRPDQGEARFYLNKLKAEGSA